METGRESGEDDLAAVLQVPNKKMYNYLHYAMCIKKVSTNTYKKNHIIIYLSADKLLI